MKCEKCGGTGKLEKKITRVYSESEPCDLCGGTGELPVSEKEIGEKLDRIIELLEFSVGIRQSICFTKQNGDIALYGNFEQTNDAEEESENHA